MTPTDRTEGKTAPVPTSDVSWKLRSDANGMAVEALLDAITELGLSVWSVSNKQQLYSVDGGWRVIRSIVRQISVPLRKLCLDNDGELLRTTIEEPVFHPLGGPKGEYGHATISFYSKRQEWELGYEDGRSETVVVPESEHKIELGRLYGVHFQGAGACKIHTPFDQNEAPIPMEDWLASQVVQINSVSYSIREVLALVANFEGAHTNDLTPWLPLGVNPEDIDKKGRKKARLMNSVLFGSMSYAQLLVLYTGAYITESMRSLLSGLAGTSSDFHSSAVELLLRNTPTDLRSESQIVNATQPLIVVGRSDVPGGKARRDPVYRIWSGSKDWDGPAPDGPAAGDQSKTVEKAGR